jgi:hypothetical protein
MKFLLIDFGASFIKGVLYDKEKKEFSNEQIIVSPFSKKDIVSKEQIENKISELLIKYFSWGKNYDIDYIFTCSIIGGFYKDEKYYTWKCAERPSIPDTPQCLISGIVDNKILHKSHSKVFNLQGTDKIECIGTICNIPVLTSISDTYSALKSVNLDSNMIINLGTGSQVFYFNKNQSYIPSGRSLLHINNFFKQLNSNLDIFEDMQKLTLESVLNGSLKINLNFFKQNYNYKEGGSIELINDNFNYCNFISSLLKSYIEQYFEFIEDYLKNKNASKNIFLLGGIPKKNKLIKEYFEYKFPQCNFIINEKAVDTHLGLAKIIDNENISYG